eukprot:929163-Pleurochrysis_carterae.AAC.2
MRLDATAGAATALQRIVDALLSARQFLLSTRRTRAPKSAPNASSTGPRVWIDSPSARCRQNTT